jgi:hypothetical protein
MGKKIKKSFLDKSTENFGYRCSNLNIFLDYHEYTQNDKQNSQIFLEKHELGEFSYWDFISAKSSMQEFSGSQICSIAELSGDLYRTSLDKIHEVFDRIDLSIDFKRVLFYFMINIYHKNLSKEYKAFKYHFKNLMN